MKYTLGQVAKATTKSKATISADLKSGKLSGEKQENGSYSIDASEVMRVYGEEFRPNRLENTEPNDTEPLKTSNEQGGLDGLVERLREQMATANIERERERQQLTDQIADLRRRLDDEGTERRRLTAVLTDQRERDATREAAQAEAARLDALRAVEAVKVEQGQAQRSGLFSLFRRRG